MSQAFKVFIDLQFLVAIFGAFLFLSFACLSVFIRWG